MSQIVLADLEQTKKRLDYYLQLKERTKSSGSRKASPVEKWVEIYTERLQKLQRQASKLAKQSQTLQ